MPGCAEELVVHKRKIEDVRQWLQQRSTPSPRGASPSGACCLFQVRHQHMMCLHGEGITVEETVVGGAAILFFSDGRAGPGTCHICGGGVLVLASYF